MNPVSLLPLSHGVPQIPDTLVNQYLLNRLWLGILGWRFKKVSLQSTSFVLAPLYFRLARDSIHCPNVFSAPLPPPLPPSPDAPTIGCPTLGHPM